LRAEIPADERAEYDARIEKRLRDLSAKRAELARRDADNPHFLLELMLVIGTALTALMVLFFWASPSPPPRNC